MKVIKLYSNRKYYDSQLKGHVTLLDIIQAVKDRDEFVVRDRTDKDITLKTINAAIRKHLEIPERIAKDLIRNFYEIEQRNFLPRVNNYERL